MIDNPASSDLAWFKASASAGNGNCVSLAALPNGTVAIRDSKDPDGPRLIFNRLEIAAFLDGAKAGEFDDLAASGEPDR